MTYGGCMSWLLGASEWIGVSRSASSEWVLHALSRHIRLLLTLNSRQALTGLSILDLGIVVLVHFC